MSNGNDIHDRRSIDLTKALGSYEAELREELNWARRHSSNREKLTHFQMSIIRTKVRLRRIRRGTTLLGGGRIALSPARIAREFGFGSVENQRRELGKDLALYERIGCAKKTSARKYVLLPSPDYRRVRAYLRRREREVAREEVLELVGFPASKNAWPFQAEQMNGSAHLDGSAYVINGPHTRVLEAIGAENPAARQALAELQAHVCGLQRAMRQLNEAINMHFVRRNRSKSQGQKPTVIPLLDSIIVSPKRSNEDWIETLGMDSDFPEEFAAFALRLESLRDSC